MMTEPRGPVLFEIEDEPARQPRHEASAGPATGRPAPHVFEADPEGDRAGYDPAFDPAAAPPVPDAAGSGQDAAAMQRLAVLAARPARPLTRWFWGLLVSTTFFFATLALWAFVANLLAANPVLGAIAGVLLIAFGLVCLAIILREVAAFTRLARLDTLQHQAADAIAARDLKAARAIAEKLAEFYSGRLELRWSRDNLKAGLADAFDADAALALAEAELLAPLDAQAVREVENAARQVATVTALVPIAFADIIAALTSNLRMIRRIGEIYGGRSGALGTWRLARAVLTHIVATGMVAVGDDLIGSVAGGSVLSKLSRRFGEGIVNGALTARVGVAAMEVCRPLPFLSRRRPSVSKLLGRALAGLFARAEAEAKTDRA